MSGATLNRLLFGNVRWLLLVAIFILAYAFSGASADAEQCPSAGKVCRETAPGGALLHNRNAAGRRVWTVACKQRSNTSPRKLDKICQQISTCPAAGGFGKFLQAVTSGCKGKHFDGYFGLDGMTYGILDWTSNNLPTTLKAYEMRDKKKFDEIFAKLNLPMKNGCLDPKWVCDKNKRGLLICPAKFYDAFALSVKTAEFQKAQVDMALRTYETRIKRFAQLGLKTEYGNTAMAVVANNLQPKISCRPARWKAICAGQSDETKLVQCMLRQYVKNACRGSADGSKRRAAAINQAFAGSAPSTNIHPTADAIIACSNNWGTSSD